MRWLILVLVCGCNQSALSPSGDAGNFCGDPNSARVELNGQVATSPSVSGMPLILDCCEGGIVTFISQQLSHEVQLQWRVQAGPQPGLPATVDLAKLPQAWGVTINADCDATGKCGDSLNSLADSFSGMLTVEGDFQSGFSTSACLTATAATPHSILNAVKIWLPKTKS
jgi:hypothetical protein